MPNVESSMILTLGPEFCRQDPLPFQICSKDYASDADTLQRRGPFSMRPPDALSRFFTVIEGTERYAIQGQCVFRRPNPRARWRRQSSGVRYRCLIHAVGIYRGSIEMKTTFNSIKTKPVFLDSLDAIRRRFVSSGSRSSPYRKSRSAV